MNLSMDEFRKQLQDTLLAAQDQARRAGSQPWHGFWYHRPDEDFPPRSVRRPEDYAGGEHLAIACTQTELPAKAQKALVEAWCEGRGLFFSGGPNAQWRAAFTGSDASTTLTSLAG